jgi:hypothetical protein
MSTVSPLDVRTRLKEAIELDLVGPWPGHAFATENLRGWLRPSSWYLTGFLIPSGTPPEKSCDTDEDDELDVVPERSGLEEESAEERKAAKKGFFPSSMGLSFLVPGDCRELKVRLQWGDYSTGEVAGASGSPVPVWKRTPRDEILRIALGEEPISSRTFDVPVSGGLQLHVLERVVDLVALGDQLPGGTRSISLFLVNHRKHHDESPDTAYAFQPCIEVVADCPFVPRPNLRGARAAEWDEQVADLHFADAPEYAAGHGVSAEWDIEAGECRRLRTAFVASAQVERTVTNSIPGTVLEMETLGALASGAAAEAALQPLVASYRQWIDDRRHDVSSLAGQRRETAEELLRYATLAAARIDQGIAALVSDADVLDSFRVANRAVARALRQRLGAKLEGKPRWHAFQLAFLLLNLTGLADPQDPHRNTVDLLFFPTGGGKTEAYLGLAAFTMVLRRLRHGGPAASGRGGAGVAVIMRYTLRLLTLDQLSRAAGMVCALELERQDQRERYGTWPFEIGLWVGKAATPNNMKAAIAQLNRFKSKPGKTPAPIPLENCPWCGQRFAATSFSPKPPNENARELRITCTNWQGCEFSGDNPLPIVAVDETLYRRLPAFLIATIDKFASLPWVGNSGVLLGGADRYDEQGFYGAAEPRAGTRLPEPLAPPDLIIQDELHLISGPLGTMAGLYEAAIEALCVRESEGRQVRPKIVASTATVRRASDQIQALFGRSLTQIFPPPGPDRQDSFFATTVSAEKVPARLYLGIAAQGRNPKVVLRRAWLTLMSAAERAYRDAGGRTNPENPADPYMTVLGYFNSLRELGGARRILEEEVQNTLKGYGGHRRIGEEGSLFADRSRFSEVLELTSREPTDKVADTKRRLENSFHQDDHVDCAIATNMISVGLDIPRLGLMVVLGQPKSHSEYIQASSRVGRDKNKPGLVLTLLNIHKPRDRSHYERFRHYHETFYRSVEVASVTPFSPRALDRGFAGALVTLARHLMPELTPPSGAEKIGAQRPLLERRLREIFLARIDEQPIEDPAEREERKRSVQNRIVDLLDSWRKICDDYRAVGASLQYQRWESSLPKPLLRDLLERDFESEHHRKFRVNRSLRDVEPVVDLFVSNLDGLEEEE